MATTDSPVTHLLADWKKGNSAALDELLPLVYRELHKLAASSLRKERPGHTLQPTALIHEAYLRMAGQEVPDLKNRSHFFAIAARIMRQILVDHARSRAAKRRGGIRQKVTLEEAVVFTQENASDLVAMDMALNKLTQIDERKARIVEMRVFAGMSVEETAEALCISEPTVKRDTRLAQAWLRRELGI